MFSMFVLTPPLLNFHFLFMNMLLVCVGEVYQGSLAICTAFFSSFLCLKRDRSSLCLCPGVRVIAVGLREELSFVSAFGVNICQVNCCL